jgi:hypothetical protein
MHSAERERLVQAYNAGNSSKAAPICGGCLAMLMLIVVLGSPPRADEYAQATRPTVIAAAPAKRVGGSEQHRQQTFEARRVAFTERRLP